MSDPSIGAMLRELARLRSVQQSGEPVEVRWARTRERLVAAFGEADIADAVGERVGE